MISVAAFFDELEKIASSSAGHLVRVSADGTGIYGAVRRRASREEWKGLLGHEGINWLPKPEIYADHDKKLESWFTPEGYEKFQEKTLPLLSKHIPDHSWKVETVHPGKVDVAYSDKYQVVGLKK